MSLEFSTNVYLQDQTEERYQFLYATQLYDTFYGVYGKFTCRQDQSEPNRMIIERIDFIGINYKGPKTIKMCKHQSIPNHLRVDSGNEPESAIDPNTNVKTVSMDLWLQASIDDPQPILDKPHLDFSRYVNANNDFSVKNGDYMKITRKLERMNPDNTLPEREQAWVKGHFDSEFWVRDGLTFKAKCDDAMTINYANGGHMSHEDDISIINQIKTLVAPSINCVPAVIKFIL